MNNGLVAVYRPTIRCSKKYEKYVDSIQKTTNLDRNQIIRLAMFTAPFSGIFRSSIEGKLKQGIMDCPLPLWTLQEDGLWLTQGEK